MTMFFSIIIISDAIYLRVLNGVFSLIVLLIVDDDIIY